MLCYIKIMFTCQHACSQCVGGKRCPVTNWTRGNLSHPLKVWAKFHSNPFNSCRTVSVCTKVVDEWCLQATALELTRSKLFLTDLWPGFEPLFISIQLILKLPGTVGHANKCWIIMSLWWKHITTALVLCSYVISFHYEFMYPFTQVKQVVWITA